MKNSLRVELLSISLQNQPNEKAERYRESFKYIFFTNTTNSVLRMCKIDLGLLRKKVHLPRPVC